LRCIMISVRPPILTCLLGAAIFCSTFAPGDALIPSAPLPGFRTTFSLRCEKAVFSFSGSSPAPRQKNALRATATGGDQLIPEAKLKEVGRRLETIFGATGDFTDDALARRGLTEGFWKWRDDRIAESEPSANPLLQAFATKISSMLPSRYELDPQTLTYGEFPLELFTQLLSAAEPQPGDIFCDVGSGCGRLVLAAAFLWPDTLRGARGIEISPDLHAAAQRLCSEQETGDCPIDFMLADVHTQPQLLADVDICFCYSTRMQLSEDGFLSQLADTYAEGLRSGSRMVTIDRHLRPDGPWDLISEIKGPNRENGGVSVGKVWRMR